MSKPMYVDLEGRAALVTGGGTGIGRAISMALARCGCGVVVNYSRSRSAAEETVAEIEKAGGRAITVQADVTDEKQVESLVAKTCEHFGKLDILVANAGAQSQLSPTDEMPAEEWDKGMAINCKSVFFCVKHAIRVLPDEIGRIVVTSSISARSGSGPGMVAYAAAKGALNNMVRSWAKELGPRGINVNAIAPGVIWTRMHENMTSQEQLNELIKRIPLGHVGEPEHCAGTVLLLVSDESSYITGQIIEINGGMQMP